MFLRIRTARRENLFRFFDFSIFRFFDFSINKGEEILLFEVRYGVSMDIETIT